MRLAVVIPSLAGGGIERMRIHLINEWLKQGIEIDLVVSQFKGSLTSLVPKGVGVFEVASKFSFLFPLGFYQYLKKRKPTHILSAGNDINAIVLAVSRLCSSDISIVVSFHNHLTTDLMWRKRLGRFKIKFANCVLRRFLEQPDSLAAVSKGVAKDLERHFPKAASKIRVIYNPVVTEKLLQSLSAEISHNPVPKKVPWLLFAGRLVNQKGLDILIKAFEIVSKQSNVHLVIAGEGILHWKLNSLVENKGLDERVHFVGFQQNILPWMRECSGFVLPSRFEGLGNVIIEALLAGTQIISTDCPSGPSEILEKGRFGQLVPVEDVNALACAILKLLSGKVYFEPDMLRERAKCFGVDKIGQQYLSCWKK